METKRETGGDDTSGLMTRDNLTLLRDLAPTHSVLRELVVHHDLLARMMAELTAAFDDCLQEASDNGVDRKKIKVWRSLLEKALEIVVEAHPDKE